MKKHVLILGGGFAGVQAAIELHNDDRFSVTLVSDRDYLFLYPTSIWIPTRGTTFERTSVPLNDIRKAYGFSLIVEPVREIRTSERTVRTESQTLSYDYLIIAVGAEKLMPPGVEHTHSICGKPELSLAVRERLDVLVNQGSGRIAVGFGGNPKDSSAVRGGPAFEFMFNVDHYLRQKGMRQNFDLTFFAPMESPGERMGTKAVRAVNMMLERKGISKRFGKKIKSFHPDGVKFEDDSYLGADLVMFIPGASGHSLFRNSDLPLTDAGFIRIDDSGLATGTSNVYASGDSAAIEGPAWRAKQGHLAEVMARTAARNIVRQENGSPEREGYGKHINILCIMDTGNGAALVYRNDHHQFLIPLPVVGHWLKHAWGWYARVSKTYRFHVFPRF
ncbi:MAG: FAD-dependent oxidoreductase [Bacteroidetes bacterium]|nr:FAD-dependent oxidoreductase [Bacteroidota bacterium]